MTKRERCTAILLAAGSGSRMKSSVAKQFMLLGGKPLIWHSLQALERSEVIDDCLLVTGEADVPFVQREIVEAYGFSKVSAVIPGGAERWESVWKAMTCLRGRAGGARAEGYLFICDGARPFLTEKLLQDTYRAARRYRACVAAVPSKDTVKLSDGEGFAVSTPDRSRVWSIQTPQVFEAELILQAYLALGREREALAARGVRVTDDASVAELFTDVRVKLVEADYRNIKITTPEDLLAAESFLADEAD